MEEKTIVEEKQPKEAKPKNEKPKKKSSFIKYILNIVLVLAVTGVTVGITFAQESENIFNAMAGFKWKWIGIALAFVAGAFLLRSLIYLCFGRLYTRKYHIHQAVALDQIGVFYSAVTPGASGGQFMQAYTYKKQGLPISAGASIMVMSSIIYQVILIIYGILSISIRFDDLINIPPFEISFGSATFNIPVIPLIFVGFLVNLAVIGILLLMSYSKKFHHFMCGPMISFLALLHIVKDKEQASESLRIQVENFKIELRRLLSNIPFTILVSILYFCVLTCLFAVPCFVGKALGAEYDITWSTVWESIFMSNFHQMVTGLIPIPGSAGVSELFFAQLFGDYFGPVQGASITAAAQLIWRTITFTLPLVIGGLVSAFYHASPKEEVNRRDINRKTFVNLQHETFVEREAAVEEAIYTTRLTRQAILDSLRIRDKKDRDEERKRKKRENESHSNHEKSNSENKTEWDEMNIGDDDEDD